MELAQENLIKIAKVSRELGKVLTDTPGGASADISRVQFWLDKIKVTSQEILETLSQCIITGSGDSTLDEQLHGWISANGPVICLMALSEMKRTITTGRAEKPFLGFVPSSLGFNPWTGPTGSNRIREAIKVLHNHRHYFDYLLTPGVWTHELESLHRWRAASPGSSLGGDDTPHRKQGQMNGRDVVMRRMCHNSYSSFSPSRETVVDKPEEENFDCSSTENLNDVCYRRAGSVATPSVVHDGQAMQGSGQPVEADFVITPKLHDDNVLLGNTLHRTEILPSQKKEYIDHVDLEKLDILLQWFDAFRCFEKHRATLVQRQADTCTWLPETNEYKRWLDNESSFLWLHGKAGCGKSVLVASVIDRLEKTLTDEPPVFFYCDFGKEMSMDATEVIRSLLYQLVDQYRRRKVKRGASQVVDELVEERRKGDATLKDITFLSSLVSRVAAQFNRPPLVVIDALDECKDVDRLLCALLGLKTERLRLFVSSRPIQVIKYRFRRLPCISVDKMVEAVSTDIQLHVNREIDSDPRLGFLDPELKKRVHSTLCQKADGMFRWVQCQLDTLKGCFTLQEFLEALDNLPLGLDATYERILRGIDQRLSEGKVTQHVLSWLATASRPLILMEVFEALSIDLQKRTLDRSKAPIHKFALLDALGSLVVHDEETDIINLSHFSVKEYLMDELTRKKMPTYHINLRQAHQRVFQSCMCYLTASLNHPFDDNETVQSRPLLDYIFSCGFDHLAHLDPPDNAILDSMIALRSEIPKHPLEWTYMSRFASLYQPYKSWITPDHDFILCVLISMFPEPFLHALLHRSPRKTKYSSNPFVHTVQLDKVDHARTLLLHGVDVNSVGWDIEDSEGLRRSLKLPLEAALQRDNSMFVDLFLKEGSAMVSRKVYSTIFNGQHCDYPPQFVSSLLQADDFVEWAAEVHDAKLLLRALNRDRYRQRQVTEEDLLVMIRRLVQIERNTSPLGSSEQILLIVALAASGGHLTLLEYLFSINAPMPSGILIFVTEKTSPFVYNLTLQGVNVRAAAAKGDATLRQVLGRCTGDSRCWVFDCTLCSAIRPVLLAALGREIDRTLTNVLTISREVIALVNADATGRKIGGLEIPLVLSQLEKIVLASGALLQATHMSFWDNSAIDYRSRRWLSGKEPIACLETLQHMIKLARVDMTEESVVNSEGSNHWHGDELAYPLPTQDKINDVVALFNEQQSHFRFLLEFDLDETDSPLRPRSDAIAFPDVAQTAQDTDGDRAATSPTSDRNERLQDPNEAQDIKIEPSNSRLEPIVEIDVIFVGQTGVGKSSLINMLRGIPDHSAAAARVGNDARPCTTHTTLYTSSLDAGERCCLWDTRGFDEVTPAGTYPLMSNKLVDRIFQLGSQKARELKETLRDRTRLATPILVFCIDASKIDVQVHWQQFQEVYIEYTSRMVMPVVVVTRGPPKAPEWEARCRDQLRQLNLGFDVPLLMVRRHRGPSSPEYIEDSRALRDLISRLLGGDLFGRVFGPHPFVLGPDAR